MAVIAIDFDGVLNSTDNHPKFGEPILDAQYAMKRLQRSGHELIIFSTRATDTTIKAQMASWLTSHRIPFHNITNIKPNSDVFIDDKAIHFTNWVEVLSEIKSRRW